MTELRPLGRLVQHDPRSLAFPADAAETVRTVTHRRRCKPFDQGTLRSCTGNAMAGLLMTDPYWRSGRRLTEVSAVKFYRYATAHDEFPGQYPPDDTGSSGLAVAKAAKAFGYCKGYAHAFGLDHVLGALTLAPLIVGVPWYEGFDTPSPTGLVRISGAVRGGHEFELVGLDTTARTVTACNSWGEGWGKAGYFSFGWDDLARLLSESGDATTISV